jgi:3-deoxy-manno-octulosonate cytidylyltransferase (CMP-KDO synthetase)
MVATDSEEIRSAVESFGGRAVMTSPEHASGTDRAAEVAASFDYDIIVNVQGDEPLIRAEMIDAVIELLGDERASLGTLARQAENPLETESPNVVKVVFDMEGFALYFSRSPIPYQRHEGAVYHHVGIYSYRREALMRLTSLEPTSLERTEGLEQLRALEHGMRIKVGMTEFKTLGVDTPEDLEKVENWLSSSS